MRLRVFTAGLSTETNTFAPWLTGRSAFEAEGVFRGDATTAGLGPECLVARLYRNLCARDGHAFVEGLFANAQPSGPTVQSVYEGYRDEIVDQLRREGPFDLVLLELHGAMVATACEDCEGDLIAHVRAAVGDQAVIGVELDPHCHLSEAMVGQADVVILMKEYPHSDFLERGRELYDLCVGKRLGRVRPMSALFDMRMVGFYPTTSEPMASLLETLRAAEAEPDVLSVSFAHGFPWGDTPSTGSRLLAITDGDPELAESVARRLGMMIYAQREALLPRYPCITQALQRAVEFDGRVVLADVADNPGGGAPGDNPTLLRAILAAGVRDAAVGCFWDPIAVQACEGAGVGTTFPLRLGGKCGLASGDPLDLLVTVRAARDNHEQSGLGSAREPFGRSVWVETQGVDVVITSVRAQTYHPNAFTGLGVELDRKRLIAVKSSQHFRAGFSPIADLIIQVATPGAIQMNFAEIGYSRKRDLTYFPRVADPLSARL